MTRRPPTLSCSSSGCHHDDVERRQFRPAEIAVADAEVHILVAEAGQVALRAVGQLRDDFNRADFGRQFGEHGRLVTRSGADLEHATLRGEAGELGHERHDVRLGNRLPLPDGERTIIIGEAAGRLRDELMPRRFAHSLQHRGRAYAARLDLFADHLLALGGFPGHGFSVAAAAFDGRQGEEREQRASRQAHVGIMRRLRGLARSEEPGACGQSPQAPGSSMAAKGRKHFGAIYPQQGPADRDHGVADDQRVHGGQVGVRR